MSDEPPPTDERNEKDVAYFMIRVERLARKHPPSLAGTIERLGTGEKRQFQDGTELLRLVGGWPSSSCPNKD